MSSQQKVHPKTGLSIKPDAFGSALCHVLTQEQGKENILGQAWLAGPGKLITCGHVIERYVHAPHLISVRFPASNNIYPLKKISLHPSFVRQPDGLVKFDLALLDFSPASPEAFVAPLPFAFEKELNQHQALWAIRYPTHLGQFSAAMQPLAQEGSFLGELRKHDSFHLLHDLPLAPGDSGSPLIDGEMVVAVHCGDTATIPGLNLPATSIRLCIWVDALRELGVTATSSAKFTAPVKHLGMVLTALLFSLLISFVIGALQLLDKTQTAWKIDQPNVMPVKLSFNEPLHDYRFGEDISVNIVPSSDCYIYLFQIDQDDNVAVLYPHYGVSAKLLKGESRTINYFGYTKLTANPSRDKWHLVVIDASGIEGEGWSQQIIKEADWQNKDKVGRPLDIKGKELIRRIDFLVSHVPPGKILHSFIESPSSK